jgi:hypothetical protein
MGEWELLDRWDEPIARKTTDFDLVISVIARMEDLSKSGCRVKEVKRGVVIETGKWFIELWGSRSE